MHSAAMQACKVQATSLAKSAACNAAGAASARGVLRPTAPSFVKCPTSFIHTTRGGPIGVTEALSPASPSAATSERQSPPSSPRRSINDLNFQLKFIFPNVLTGAVMGKGGENVNRIRDATGAFIQASRAGSAVSSTRDRMIIIAANDYNECKRALRMLLASIKEQNLTDKLERIGYPGRVFLKQVIPAPCAGKVLGPGGDQIQSISATTQATVAIEAKPINAAFIPFRYVNYMGSNLDILADAVDKVTDLLNQDERYIPGIREITSVAFKIVPIPEKRAGSLLGPGGIHIKTLQDVLRVKMGICEGNTPGSRFVAVWGAPMNVNVALDVIAVATGQTPMGAADRLEEDQELTDFWGGLEEHDPDSQYTNAYRRKEREDSEEKSSQDGDSSGKRSK